MYVEIILLINLNSILFLVFYSQVAFLLRLIRCLLSFLSLEMSIISKTVFVTG